MCLIILCKLNTLNTFILFFLFTLPYFFSDMCFNLEKVNGRITFSLKTNLSAEKKVWIKNECLLSWCDVLNVHQGELFYGFHFLYIIFTTDKLFSSSTSFELIGNFLMLYSLGTFDDSQKKKSICIKQSTLHKHAWNTLDKTKSPLGIHIFIVYGVFHSLK